MSLTMSDMVKCPLCNGTVVNKEPRDHPLHDREDMPCRLDCDNGMISLARLQEIEAQKGQDKE